MAYDPAADTGCAWQNALFTEVTGGSHTWLWRSTYGQSNQDLWDFFLETP